jgi:hypothetical protein
MAAVMGAFVDNCSRVAFTILTVSCIVSTAAVRPSTRLWCWLSAFSPSRLINLAVSSQLGSLSVLSVSHFLFLSRHVEVKEVHVAPCCSGQRSINMLSLGRSVGKPC